MASFKDQAGGRLELYLYIMLIIIGVASSICAHQKPVRTLPIFLRSLFSQKKPHQHSSLFNMGRGDAYELSEALLGFVDLIGEGEISRLPVVECE